MIGLIDCNNFFVSCERLFKPGLNGKPVVVASNNDGCAVAMSNEAKAIGITRGIPLFQVKDLVKKHNVIVLHGNHKLYGDLSARVIATIESVIPDIEVYSIDEAFIHFPDLDNAQIEALGREIVTKVRRWVGIPVSLGIAPTKTLAKIAARFAKKYPAYRAVCMIDDDRKRCKALELTDIGDVWGIGRRMVPKLRSYDIHSALDFAQMSKTRVERLMNVIGCRTWTELNGEACIGEENEAVAHKQICTSRTFTPALTSFQEMDAAISRFVAIASRKLRRQRLVARGLTVFIQTNTYRKDLPQYQSSAFAPLDEPTGDVMTLTKLALSTLKRIYREGLIYRRGGVIITDTLPSEAMQPSLFSDAVDRKKRTLLNSMVDTLNGNKYQTDKIKVASSLPVRKSKQ